MRGSFSDSSGHKPLIFISPLSSPPQPIIPIFRLVILHRVSTYGKLLFSDGTFKLTSVQFHYSLALGCGTRSKNSIMRKNWT